MRVKTQVECPLCKKMAKVISFRKSVDAFIELRCECTCGTKFLAEAIEMKIVNDEIEFKPGNLPYFPFREYEWSRERVEDKNPSER